MNRSGLCRTHAAPIRSTSGRGVSPRSPLHDPVIHRLRMNYFSHGGHLGARYGVSVDRLVRHVVDGFARRGLVPAAPLRHVADLIHAAACVDRSVLAWSDLHERHEGALVRLLIPMAGDAEALLIVRRMLADLRAGTCSAVGGARGPSLRDYLGRPSLRHWLGALADEAIEAHTPARPVSLALHRVRELAAPA
jgi:hypothetical protein